MAYYDESHLERLEKIHQIKKEYFETSKTSRLPIDFIKHRLNAEGPKSAKRKKSTGSGPKSKNDDPERQKRKQEIIDASLEVYAQKGYYQSRVRDITKEAGISTPTFYYYCTDKSELFVEGI